MSDIVLRLRPFTDIVALADRTLVRNAHAMSTIRGIEADDLEAILRQVDGVSSIAEIVERLRDTYDEESVLAVLDALRDDALEVVSSSRLATPRAEVAPVLVLGTGALAKAIIRELGDEWGIVNHTDRVLHGKSRETGRRLATAAKAKRARASQDTELDLSKFSAVVYCAENVPFSYLFELNRLCLEQRVPCVFVTNDGERITVGPTLVPWKTPCFECSLLTSLLTRADADTREACASFYSYAIEPKQRGALATVARRAVDELHGLLRGEPYPQLFYRLAHVSRDAAVLRAPIYTSTDCTSCHALRPHGLQSVEHGLTPDLAGFEGDTGIVDHTGGFRSHSIADAQRRASRALDTARIGVNLRTSKGALVAHLTPLRRAPFYYAEPAPNYSPQSPIVYALADAPRAYGKGVTQDQAWCSAVFELFEGMLAVDRGEKRIVRASYEEVKHEAIDLPRRAATVLPHFRSPVRKPFDPNASIDWIWARDLIEDKPLLVPATVAFPLAPLGAFRDSMMLLPRRGSTGMSAGCTLLDSTLQGLFEVVEHDAWYAGFLTGVKLPAIDLDTIPDEASRELVALVQKCGYDVVVRDISNDLGVPVIEANAVARQDPVMFFAQGHGCHLDPVIAVRRALTEMCQALIRSGLEERRAREFAPDNIMSQAHSYLVHQRSARRISRTISFSEVRADVPSDASIRACIKEVTRRIQKAIPEVEICAVDLSTPALPDVCASVVFVSDVQDIVDRPTHVVPRVFRYPELVRDASTPPPQVSDLCLQSIE